jgi:hydroxyethylthiazole kinase
MFEKILDLTTQIKQQGPLVLNITNYVTMDFVANGLLSIGASPVMSHEPEEIQDLIAIASVVVINPGTLDENFVHLCEAACKAANQLNKPLILDPVGVGASSYRTAVSKKLISDYQIAIIRGNASEIMALAGLPLTTKGVDSNAGTAHAVASAKALAAQGSTVLISGAVDVVVNAEHEQGFSRGSAMMPMITGTGCLLSAVVAAFHAVQADAFAAASAAALFYSVCGENAAAQSSGPGSFKTKFLDSLYATPEASHYAKN